MAIDLKRVSNPDGSRTLLVGPYDNGLYVRYDYPPGADDKTPASKVSSVKSDGVTVVPDPAGSKPGQSARDSGAIKGTTFENGTALGNALDAVGLGTAPRPATAEQGSDENPNPAYQTKQDYDARNDLLGYNTEDRATGDKIRTNQDKLVTSLDRTINDPNAPSVARTQLAINNDLNNRSALGSAAGVGGANAFAARRQALNNIAAGNVGTEQAFAMNRAKEVADAQTAKSGVLSNQSTVNQARQNSDLSASLGYSDEAAKLATRDEDDKMKAKEKEQAGKQTFFNRLANMASMGMSSGLGSK